MSSETNKLPNESTCTPPRPAAPKLPLTARHPSPKASFDTTPAARLGHCVPVTDDIGEVPAIVVIVFGSATGACWASALSNGSAHSTDRQTRRGRDRNDNI